MPPTPIMPYSPTREGPINIKKIRRNFIFIDFWVLRHFYVIFAPGTQILLNLIPKLVGLPKFQSKRMSEMQFPNISPQSGGCYIFPKPETC